ncbi:Dph6-related ATP pyrophosphatase [Roseivirga echinicomitans]|uniref:Diphthamide synthase domain-containing protein n=1 Tax=Roseivirga echinicomitans TaxID=296218 RepID=A0A150XXH1_9BACT|nr:diphthine--ammonia ligase [Roseivirga echinicomitans]KYG83398.1 hypothetical protein AWN68_00915 [Roseivirga echinicomitans]
MKSAKPNHSCSFLCSWSGGKDSYLAFYRALQREAKPTVLFNVMNELGDKSRSHGIPREVLMAQAECIGLPIEFIESTWEDYEVNYIEKLNQLKTEYQFSHTVFGDIDIQSHRDWEEKVSEAAGLKALLPLWQEDREALVFEMLELGVKALVVSCRTEFAPNILGKVIDEELIQVFQNLEIDICGENGEYHTLVIDGPAHKKPLLIDSFEIQSNKGYSFLDIRKSN